MEGSDLLAARSKALFNNQHLLTVCTWIGSAERVFRSTDIAAGTNVSSTTVHRTLSALTLCDLVTRLPRSTSDRSQWYERVDGAFWTAVEELASGLRVGDGVPQ